MTSPRSISPMTDDSPAVNRLRLEPLPGRSPTFRAPALVRPRVLGSIHAKSARATLSRLRRRRPPRARSPARWRGGGAAAARARARGPREPPFPPPATKRRAPRWLHRRRQARFGPIARRWTRWWRPRRWMSSARWRKDARARSQPARRDVLAGCSSRSRARAATVAGTARSQGSGERGLRVHVRPRDPINGGEALAGALGACSRWATARSGAEAREALERLGFESTAAPETALAVEKAGASARCGRRRLSGGSSLCASLALQG